MRLLGIDYGTKKIGLACSDESGKMAFPYRVIKNDEYTLSLLERICAEEHISEIVIGHSLNVDGEANPVQEHINELITDLTLNLGLPVHLEPEQYTSQEAARIQGKDEHTDAAAAAIILNSYITKQQNKDA